MKSGGPHVPNWLSLPALSIFLKQLEVNRLWCGCRGSCASLEGRPLKALVHCCITTSYSHHRLYHLRLFQMQFSVSERPLLMWRRLSRLESPCGGWGLKWPRGPSGVTVGCLVDHWSGHEWAAVTVCEMKRINEFLIQSSGSRVNAENLDGGLSGRPGCMCPLSVFLVSKIHFPARPEHSRSIMSMAHIQSSHPPHPHCLQR